MTETTARVRHSRVEPVPFGPGWLLWDLAGDHRGNLVFLAPTLMQAMHPVIGDALARMPVALTDPFGRRERSVDSIHLWVYGGPEALVEARRLAELHKPVKGRDTDGRDVSALNPEVWAWVPLSSYTAFLTQCRVFGEPLDEAGKERLYEEIKNLARILGVRERHIPATTADYWAYYDTMVSTRLTNHPFVHQVLARGLRLPPPPFLPRALAPAWKAVWPTLGRFATWLTYGTFPPEIREILGLQWTERDERRFLRVGQLIRHTARLTPERLRYPRTVRLARDLARNPGPKREQALTKRIATLHDRNTKSL
ncbi:oxygenase MpaB family protein [Amycolatopsis sp. cg5]|uniref:oxygenase MpaB family protein n=1 Tax=Amycolatopsis sp. cg5 TaxID=3238802 RepID=UPI003526849E